MLTVERARKAGLWRGGHLLYEDTPGSVRDGWRTHHGRVLGGVSSPTDASWHGNKDQELL